MANKLNNKTAIVKRTFYVVDAVLRQGEVAVAGYAPPYYTICEKDALEQAKTLEDAGYNEVTVYEYTDAKIEVPAWLKQRDDLDWDSWVKMYFNAGGLSFEEQEEDESSSCEYTVVYLSSIPDLGILVCNR